MDSLFLFWGTLTIWSFHVVLSSRALPVPTELRRLVLRSTAGIMLSCSIIASRQLWLFFGSKDRWRVFAEGVYILRAYPVVLLFGWLIAAWGLQVASDSALARTIAIALGLGLVVIAHGMIERSFAKYVETGRFERIFAGELSNSRLKATGQNTPAP